jgi:hypothetical protein
MLKNIFTFPYNLLVDAPSTVVESDWTVYTLDQDCLSSLTIEPALGQDVKHI